VHYTYTAVSNYDRWASYPVWIDVDIEANLGLVCILYGTSRNSSLVLTAIFRCALVRQLFATSYDCNQKGKICIE
jgi:hypothetical protein